MARKKCKVVWSGPGYSGHCDYLYFEEDEMNIFRYDESFRISLAEKYYPDYRGKVTNVYTNGDIEDA